jgi:hypothetical protein
MTQDRDNTIGKIESAASRSPAPVHNAPPPQIAAPPREAKPLPSSTTDDAALSKESSSLQKESPVPHASGGVLQGLVDASSKALKDMVPPGVGETVHDMKQKVDKKTRAAEKHQEGVSPGDMKRLEDAVTHGGPLKKAAASAMMGVSIKDLPGALESTKQWNNMPQFGRDAAVMGLHGAQSILGTADKVLNPESEKK